MPIGSHASCGWAAAVNPENGQKPAVSSRVGLLLGLTALLLAWRFWALPRLGITLYVDEAQYWTWAQQLDWGYFSKPPGIAALIWLSTALFGNGIVGVKALGMLCYPLAATACWAIARRLYDEEVAFWSALVVVTVPMLVLPANAELLFCHSFRFVRSPVA